MPASRTTDTMDEMLQRILQDIAAAMTFPDADIDFLSALQTIITKKLREPIDMLNQLSGQMTPSSPQGPPQQAPPQGPPQGLPPGMGGMPMPQGPGGPPIPGLMSSPNMAPAADELRRTLKKR